eukprot:scaffold10028_cov236-Isochrysis_galbana.AAC.9
MLHVGVSRSGRAIRARRPVSAAIAELAGASASTSTRSHFRDHPSSVAQALQYRAFCELGL